jgi:hypothetical protein
MGFYGRSIEHWGCSLENDPGTVVIPLWGKWHHVLPPWYATCSIAPNRWGHSLMDCNLQNSEQNKPLCIINSLSQVFCYRDGDLTNTPDIIPLDYIYVYIYSSSSLIHNILSKSLRYFQLSFLPLSNPSSPWSSRYYYQSTIFQGHLPFHNRKCLAFSELIAVCMWFL